MEFNTTHPINNNYLLLSRAEDVHVSMLARQLMDVDFECTGCGECCRSHLGDNSVIVFPDEIQLIMETQKLGWNEICRPSTPQFMDSSGTFHSFEWELIKHSSGTCKFLQENCTCSIYDYRPWICRTYPFYLVFEYAQITPLLSISECEGVGAGSFSKESAIEMATLLKERIISEVKEEIQLLEHLNGYEDWVLVRNDSIEKGVKTDVAVHDSRGLILVSGHDKW
ncbi:MAG: YkgJ family cysteine cluster protein [ANME-2 cluster archaeon]|nr:YkgJ family cysteine cluster protein [ANME-2 cluster archaeon]